MWCMLVRFSVVGGVVSLMLFCNCRLFLGWLVMMLVFFVCLVGSMGSLMRLFGVIFSGW